jgi:hypothetical protein
MVARTTTRTTRTIGVQQEKEGAIKKPQEEGPYPTVERLKKGKVGHVSAV